MDSFELTAWSLVVLLLLLPALLRIALVRRVLVRLGTAALERLTPEPVVDQEALDLYRALQRERLQRDLDRLRRVLLTDDTKSAVRQIGNRMAHDRLVHDLAELEAVVGRGPAPGTASSRARPPARAAAVEDWPLQGYDPSATAPGGQHRPVVEVLELGRRR